MLALAFRQARIIPSVYGFFGRKSSDFWQKGTRQAVTVMDHWIAPRRRLGKDDEASAQTDGGIPRGGVAGKQHQPLGGRSVALSTEPTKKKQSMKTISTALAILLTTGFAATAPAQTVGAAPVRQVPAAGATNATKNVDLLAGKRVMILGDSITQVGTYVSFQAKIDAMKQTSGNRK
ncbi:MAG: hypothetical protein NTW21_07845 [Verrucomicrobia bacterium]|nr:hypothetical protein [Verrucomicrobiota bacterium]